MGRIPRSACWSAVGRLDSRHVPGTFLLTQTAPLSRTGGARISQDVIRNDALGRETVRACGDDPGVNVHEARWRVNIYTVPCRHQLHASPGDKAEPLPEHTS